MSKPTARNRSGSSAAVTVSRSLRQAGPAEAGTFESPIVRLLDTPHLAQLVPHLAPETLHGVIQQAGLHACGGLVAAATPAQRMALFDIDLWRHAEPGLDDQLDVDRFGEWFELLAEIGGSVAADIVATIGENLVIAGLSRHIRVFDPSAIATPAWPDEEPVDPGARPQDGPDWQLGGYRVRAIKADAWDAIVALLLALEAGHPERFHAVMRGCRRLSDSSPEVDGLDHLLTAPEQLLHDVAGDREDRRSRQGYSTPADARAFLQLARQRTRQPRDGAPSTNPVAAAYFRAADDTAASADRDAASVVSPGPAPAPADGSLAAALGMMIGMLAEAGLVPQQPRALLDDPRTEPARFRWIRPLMAYVRETDQDAHFARSRELAFLANTLMSGCSLQSRPFTAQEASDAAVGICNLGLEHWPARWPGAATNEVASTAGAALPDAFLAGHDLVSAFEVGWAVLHEDVSLFVAERLVSTLRQLRSSDGEIRRELAALRRALLKAIDAGTPWRARDALDVLALLDMSASISLAGLLDECPVLAAALTAIVESRTGPVNPISFEFISTTAQIAAVHAFMAKLPGVLGP